MRSLNLAHLLVALSLGVSVPAQAQSGTPTSAAALTAESAFLEGVRLMKQGDCSEAMQRFEESQRLDPASGTLLNLAYCQTQLGKTASAWLTYRQASALAERTAKPLHAQLAREQSEKLKAALPQLRFALVGEASRLKQLKLDDEELPKESWALTVPVDPGPHQVVAVFDAGRSWQTQFSAQPAEQSVVEVKIPETEVESPAEGARAARAVEPPVPRSVSQLPTPSARSTGAPGPAAARSSGWALGLGLAGGSAVLAGSALFVSARLSYDAARDHCSAKNSCPAIYFDREQSAQSRAKLSLVLAGGGVLLLGTAAVMHFRASDATEPHAQLSVAAVGPRDFGAAYAGVF